MKFIGFLVFSICCLFGNVVAQDTKPITPITDKEQIEFLQAHDRWVQSSQKAAADQANLQAIVDRIYVSRGIKQQDMVTCFGPSGPQCAGVPEFTLELKASPKPKAEEKNLGTSKK